MKDFSRLLCCVFSLGGRLKVMCDEFDVVILR